MIFFKIRNRYKEVVVDGRLLKKRILPDFLIKLKSNKYKSFDDNNYKRDESIYFSRINIIRKLLFLMIILKVSILLLNILFRLKV